MFVADFRSAAGMESQRRMVLSMAPAATLRPSGLPREMRDKHYHRRFQKRRVPAEVRMQGRLIASGRAGEIQIGTA